MRRRRVGHDLHIQKRPLAALDIAAKILAENFLRNRDVEQVILNLKAQAEVLAELAEELGLGVIRAGDQRAHLGANRQQAGGLAPDHVQIMRQGDIFPLLKIQIERLAFANFDDAVGKNLRETLQIWRVRAQQAAISQDEQS